MELLVNAQSLIELKRAYKKLAYLFHPDRGGDGLKMKQLNALYHRLIDQLANKTEQDDFNQLNVGDRLYVNGTEAEVLAVTSNSFRVVAVGRNRQAVFDRQSGIGKYNRRLRASFNPDRYARYQ